MNIRRLSYLVALSVAAWLLWRWQRRQQELPLLEPPLPAGWRTQSGSTPPAPPPAAAPAPMPEVAPSHHSPPLSMPQAAPPTTVPLPPIGIGKPSKAQLTNGQVRGADSAVAAPQQQPDSQLLPDLPEPEQTPLPTDNLPASPAAAASDAVAPLEGPAAPEQLDLNTATLDELIALPGIGPALARRIIAYRSAHGPFARVSDIIAVQGIGPNSLREFEHLLAVKVQDTR